MKLLFTFALLFLVGVYSQPTAIQYIQDSYETAGVFNYGVIRLSDGATLDNATFTSEYFSIWGILAVNDTNILTLGSAPSSGNIVSSFSIESKTFTTVYSQPPQGFGFGFGQQPIYWDQNTLTAYVAGLALSNNDGTLAIIPLGFGQDIPNEAISLGVDGSFTTSPIGAYDGSNYYYVYYQTGNTIGLVKYSFSQYTYTSVILTGDNTQVFYGTQQLIYYNNQLYLATLDTNTGVNIATVDFETTQVDIIYKDTSSNKLFKGTIQPFIYDSASGSLIILNPAQDQLYVDIFNLATQKVKSSVIPNTIPQETFYIVPSTATVPFSTVASFQ
ncbi:hypothetical protein DFA_02067 [Cavenderia fasciculata]|uniref:Uncharacterized protein n=1 Tax=Cavenderia fasciculata TaxID=261658 RepID=F4PYL4_CACFS|nr:uncharacterized protein DFA_02067 [Cavenderia fasciculata]EGG19280.1 hypothetical protein DFA_02067 [Cavenderia fasciculata]|eukprot:XP_004357551.1 hypothetical protein DFA_02067 [Cavenderia fasciculata]